MTDIIKGTVDYLCSWLPESLVAGAKETEKVVATEIKTVLPAAGMAFVRLAGLSGALAVSLGAYGAHVMIPSKADPQLIKVFETGNRYHMLHSIVLLAVPLTKRPQLVGSLISAGMLLFCGSCYFHALTGNAAYRQVTPFGGMLLIAGWISVMFWKCWQLHTLSTCTICYFLSSWLWYIRHAMIIVIYRHISSTDILHMQMIDYKLCFFIIIGIFKIMMLIIALFNYERWLHRY